VLEFLEVWGWCGVDLFLVLSAYLITSLLLIEHERRGSISLRSFYLRRILRIWPLYYMMTTFGFFVLPTLAIGAPALGSPGWWRLMHYHFLPYYTLFGNYSSGAHGYPGVPTLGHLWTVTLEEQFYIVWPVLLSLMLRLRRRAPLWGILALLLAGSIVLRLHLFDRAPHPYVWTNTLARLDPLIFGIVVALWRQTHSPKLGWLGPLLKLTLGVGCISAIALGPHIETQSQSIVWQFLAVAGGFALILDAVLPLGRNPLSWFLSRRPLVWLGKLTYGLYVYHIISLEAGGIIVQAVQRHWWADSPLMALLLRSLVSFAITVTIAAISYRFFESFFLRLKDKFSRVKSRPVDQTLA